MKRFMTSHYLRCTAKGSFEDIFQRLSMKFGNVYAKKFGTMGESLKGIIFGEQYFFRVSNDAALLITLEEISIGETRLEIIACAAGKGLLGILTGPTQPMFTMWKTSSEVRASPLYPKKRSVILTEIAR